MGRCDNDLERELLRLKTLYYTDPLAYAISQRILRTRYYLVKRAREAGCFRFIWQWLLVLHRSELSCSMPYRILDLWHRLRNSVLVWRLEDWWSHTVRPEIARIDPFWVLERISMFKLGIIHYILLYTAILFIPTAPVMLRIGVALGVPAFQMEDFILDSLNAIIATGWFYGIIILFYFNYIVLLTIFRVGGWAYRKLSNR